MDMNFSERFTEAVRKASTGASTIMTDAAKELREAAARADECVKILDALAQTATKEQQTSQDNGAATQPPQNNKGTPYNHSNTAGVMTSLLNALWDMENATPGSESYSVARKEIIQLLSDFHPQMKSTLEGLAEYSLVAATRMVLAVLLSNHPKESEFKF